MTSDHGWVVVLEDADRTNAQLLDELNALRARVTVLEQAGAEREQALRRVKERVETILNNSPDATLLLKPDGTIGTGNPAFQELFGYHVDEIYNQFPSRVVTPAYAVVILDALRAVVDQGQAKRLEIVARRKDGTTFDADVALAPVIEPDGSVTGMVCSLRDISKLKTLDRLRDAFVSNVLHELRTPITNLKLTYELLTLNPEKVNVYVARLRRETNRLESIVEGLLRLSYLDYGRKEITSTPVDLNSLVSQYIADRVPMAESRGLTLSLDTASHLPPLYADEVLLEQALSVLLTNALNYTPTGGQVSVITEARQFEGKDWVAVSVSDTGPGIPPNEQPHLFERFYRGKVGHDSGMPGIGLGLAIAKEIVERHHGQIEVNSEGMPGRGATFTLWLPGQDA